MYRIDMHSSTQKSILRLGDVIRPPRRRSKPGAAPGTIVSDPSAAKPSIHVTAYGPSALEEVVLERAEDIHEWIGKHPVLWINIYGLGDADVIRTIGDALQFHPLALEDVVNIHQRPKVEVYEDHLFIICRMARATDRPDTEQVALFLGAGFVVTFQELPGDAFEPIRDRIRKPKARIRSLSADYLAYALLDAVVDFYFPLLETLGERLEALEERVLAQPHGSLMHEIHSIKRDLLLLRRAIWPLRDVLYSLSREPYGLIDEATRLYIRDCYDHIFQILDLVEIYREITSGLVDLHISSVGNKTNEIMKVLTIFAAIFIPLTFVAGIYGMNFNPDISPWNMPELEWYLGYPFALVLMTAIGGGLMYYFYQMGWIGNSKPDTLP